MKYCFHILPAFLLFLSSADVASAQYSTEDARAKLKKQAHVFEEAMEAGSSIHVKYDLYVSTFSQTESQKDTAHIDIKKIQDKISYTIDDEHVMLGSGNRILYYFVPGKVMDYAEDTLKLGDEFGKVFFAAMLPFIDSAETIAFKQDKKIVSYELKYTEGRYVYENIKMTFDAKTGIPLSLTARFTQTPYQQFADMQVYYKMWDKSLHEKADFPYFEKYIVNTDKGFAPLPALGQIKFAQHLNTKK